jgi:hypothetical protein
MLCLMLVFGVGCQAGQNTLGKGKVEILPNQPASLLMVEDDKGRNELLSGTPVNPVTLKPISNKLTLDLGHHYNYAVSPDRKKIAAFIWPTGKENEKGRLSFIDRTTWKGDIQQKIEVDERAGQLIYHPDGSSLLWTVPAEIDATHGVPSAFSLVSYMIEDKAEEEVLRLPKLFTPYETHVLPSGLLAMYGQTIDENNLAKDAPQLLFIDLEKKKVVQAIHIKGLADGQIQRNESGSDGMPNITAMKPGVAWDLARNRLYIVHADQNKVTVIDLQKRAIIQEKTYEPLVSLAQRIQHWLIPHAEAKMASGTDIRAVISPDGQSLFITGTKREVETQTNGVPGYRELPLELQVMDTSSLRVKHHLDLPVNDFGLSPGFGKLLLTGYTLEPKQQKNSGIYIFNFQTMKMEEHLEGKTAFFVDGFSEDFRYAYVSTWSEHPEQCIIDLKTNKIVNRKKGDGHFVSLMPLQRK